MAKRTVNPELPPRVYAVKTSTGLRYYYGKNKVPLGTDLEIAKRYAQVLEGKGETVIAEPLRTHVEIMKAAAPWIMNDKICGVYFLILEGQIVYVGQSANVVKRIWAHARKGRIKFDSVSWVACEKCHLHRMERGYIAMYDPPENRKPFTSTILETSLAPKRVVRRGRPPKVKPRPTGEVNA